MYTLPSNAVAGSIYFSEFLDPTNDIVISFDYACYGTSLTGAEGFCVFFSNSFVQYLNGGGPGPGLCYGAVSGVDTSNIKTVGLNGLNGGIIGVGFDLTGNFGNNKFYNSGYRDTVKNSIAVRSSFNSLNNIITRSPSLNTLTFGKTVNLYQQLTATDHKPDFKRVRVRLTDFGQRIVVDIKDIGDLNFTNYLNYSFTTYNNSIASSTTLSSFPISFTGPVWCGLGFANGESGNTKFKIKGFNVNGTISLSAALGIYVYDIDTTTLSATQTYTLSSVPYFNYGDQFNTENTPDGVFGHVYTNTTNPAITGIPLVYATPANAALNPGAPYVPGDIYIKITPHN
jgi:hypothetical protein